MDSETINTRKIRELLRQAEAARSVIHTDVALLKHRLDVPARIRESLSQRPGTWLFGSLGAGLLASIALRGRAPRAERKAKGWKSVVFGLAMTAARPLLKTYLTGQLDRFTANMRGNQATPGPQPRGPYQVRNPF